MVVKSGREPERVYLTSAERVLANSSKRATSTDPSSAWSSSLESLRRAPKSKSALRGSGFATRSLASNEKRVTAIFLRDDKVADWLDRYPKRDLVTDATFDKDRRDWGIGVWSSSAGEIATGRLETMPFTRLCVTCQSEFEQAQRTVQNEGNAAPAPRRTVRRLNRRGIMAVLP